jgi:hypothetical protein
MALSTILDNVPESLEGTASTRSVLAVWQRPRCLVGNEANKVLGPTLVLASDLLHTDVTQEWNQVAHSPSTSPVDTVGREFFSSAGRAVENTQSSRNKWRYLAMSERQEEALSLRPTSTSRRVFVFIKKRNLSLQPREAQVRRKRVERADHVRVAKIPGVLVRHPFSIGEDAADWAAFALDGRLITAQRLQCNDILVCELECGVVFETLCDRGCVVGDEFCHLLLAGLLGKRRAGFVRHNSIHASVDVPQNPNDLDILSIRERTRERNSSVVSARLLVRKNALGRRDQMRVALHQVFTDLLGIVLSSRCNILKPVLQNRRGPLVQESQAAGEATTVLLDLEK